MGKLKQLLDEYKTVPKGSPRDKEIFDEINRILGWMRSNGLLTSRFHIPLKEGERIVKCKNCKARGLDREIEEHMKIYHPNGEMISDEDYDFIFFNRLRGKKWVNTTKRKR